MNEQPIFKPSADSIALAERLRQLEIGDTITYTELNAVIPPGDVQGKARSALNAARKTLLQEQRVFSCVMGIGLKRLNDSEIVEQERGTIGVVRRTVRRSMKRLAVANYDNLPPTDQVQHRVTSATLGAIGLCTAKPSQLKLEQKARTSDALQVGDALKLFSKEKN